ncbi:MAG: hypothetical protein D6785_05830, partial [Planctomycetota bacterium]
MKKGFRSLWLDRSRIIEKKMKRRFLKIFLKKKYLIPFQKWLLAFLLVSPAFLGYFYYWYLDPQEFSCFIQGDQPTYYLIAKDYQRPPNSLFYSITPFWDDYVQIPKKMFQPQIFVIGMILKYTSLSIEAVNLILFIFLGLIAGRVGIYFFETLTEEKNNYMGLLLFFWGGGLLLVSSLIYYQFDLRHIADFDPWEGWWFLNFGRNFLYPLESYYHSLFFLNFLFLWKKKYFWAGLGSLLLLLSHHFTGMEWIAISLT